MRAMFVLLICVITRGGRDLSPPQDADHKQEVLFACPLLSTVGRPTPWPS
jgi:hypothetical protein